MVSVTDSVIINGNKAFLQFNEKVKVDCKVEIDRTRPPWYKAHDLDVLFV